MYIEIEAVENGQSRPPKSRPRLPPSNDGVRTTCAL
jgi:hypothetical protein